MLLKEETCVLLEEAAKCYSSKDYEGAVFYYSEVNKLYEAENGQPNADYLYLYGKSLYHSGLAKNDILGVPSDEEDGVIVTDDDKDGENAGKDQTDRMFQFGIEEEEVREQDQNDDDGSHATGKTLDSHSDNEDQSEFEAAWEVLEVARFMYDDMLKTNPECTKILEKLADTYDILGEISLESGNFQQAANDFETLLSYREKLYKQADESNRLLIEAYYKIALALDNLPDRHDDCVLHMKKAIHLLKTRIDNGIGEPDDDTLLDDLNEKLKELQNPSMLQSLKQEMLQQIATAAFSPPEKVNDLTATIKKKPRSHNVHDSASRDLKKPRN